MKRTEFLKYLGYTNESPTPDFNRDIAAAVERGESLDQLAERIDREATPDFYGAEFRRAYSEGVAAASAYGYEQPLDLHDQTKLLYGTWNEEAPEHVQRDIATRNGFEEAEFEVVGNAGGIKSIYYIPADQVTVEEVFEKERCPVELAVEKYFGLPEHCGEGFKINADFGQVVACVHFFKENYLKQQEPGKDLIITPLGEMTLEQWDGYLLGLPEAERRPFEAPEN